jgi:hypothetical protein
MNNFYCIVGHILGDWFHILCATVNAHQVKVYAKKHLMVIPLLLHDCETGPDEQNRKQIRWDPCDGFQTVHFEVGDETKKTNESKIHSFRQTIKLYIVACISITGNNLGTNNKTIPAAGIRFLISIHMQPLLTNAFANKHVPTDAIGIQQ